MIKNSKFFEHFLAGPSGTPFLRNFYGFSTSGETWPLQFSPSVPLRQFFYVEMQQFEFFEKYHYDITIFRPGQESQKIFKCKYPIETDQIRTKVTIFFFQFISNLKHHIFISLFFANFSCQLLAFKFWPTWIHSRKTLSLRASFTLAKLESAFYAAWNPTWPRKCAA